MSDNNYMNSPAAIQFGRGLIGKTIKSITYIELYTLRNISNLQQGTTYRITDYHCTSMDDNAKSAGHRFDILVTALDNKTLSEIGRAMKHDFTDDEIDPLTGAVYTQEEKDYFNDIPIEAWEVHYCLDNDQQRFNWAVQGIGLNITTVSGSHKLQYNSPLTTTLGISGKYAYTNILGNSSYNQCYLVTKSAPMNLTVGDTIELYDITNSTVLSTETISAIDYCGVPTQISSITAYLGRGVIYRLIDENNNDVCYDFKNILFKRDADWRTTYSGYYDTNVFNSEHEWFYTFTSVTLKDTSISLEHSIQDNRIFDFFDNYIQLPGSIYLCTTVRNELGKSTKNTIKNARYNIVKNMDSTIYATSSISSGNFYGNYVVYFNNNCIRDNIADNDIRESRNNLIQGSCNFNILYGFNNNNTSSLYHNNITGVCTNNVIGGTLNRNNITGQFTYNTINRSNSSYDILNNNNISGVCNHCTFDTMFRYSSISGYMAYCTFVSHHYQSSDNTYTQTINVEGMLSYCNFISGNATTKSTNVSKIDLSATCRWFYANFTTVDDGNLSHIRIDGNKEGTSEQYVSITIPSNPNNRTINVDIDANGNPIVYFPSDQEELIENITATTATLYPKRMYVWGTVASLDLSLASTGSSVVNEYHFRFTADSGMTLSLPSGITWANGTVPPRTQGKTYEISIIGNYASYLEF